ncbi:SigE family RNA polymerase sigma factor [Nocardioides zeae]|uniref:SigE family RNA polymerase sigma factor n=1 Tax=Nocardioides zeae TaxID=1457234 RepID=A0A6P0HFH9_9ACTN|nr:SigE family RNA polymerase sigma factor [Nocardioides zeae]NEN77438.1 SigE family RNA polymerase sigma factor [Nocardioides zeae]
MTEASFEEFIAASQPRLTALARSISRETAAADDLVQGVMEQMWIVWQKDRPVNPHSYARTALVRRHISSQRRAHRRREVLGMDPTDVPAPSSFDAATSDRWMLVDALRRLPPRQREVVVLRYFEDLTIEEVADLLGISQGAVKRHAHRGVARLRTILAPAPAPTPAPESRSASPQFRFSP